MCKKYCFISIVLLFSLGINSIAAVNTLWDNNSGDQNWNTAGNWQWGVVPVQTPGGQPLFQVDNTMCWLNPAFAFDGSHPIITDPNAACDWIMMVKDSGPPTLGATTIILDVNGLGARLDALAIFIRSPKPDIINTGGYIAKVLLNEGTIDVATLVCDDDDGSGTLDQNGIDFIQITGGGTLNVGELFYNVPVGQSRIDITDGTMNLLTDLNSYVGAFSFQGNCGIDITGGTLTLPGDIRTDHPAEWAQLDPRVTAHNGRRARLIDYNVTNSGKTTIRAASYGSADLDFDGDVDFADFAFFSAQWLDGK